MEKYRNYNIQYNPKPGPTNLVYDFEHEGYDGAIDSNDNRCGCGISVEDCKSQIDEIEDNDE